MPRNKTLTEATALVQSTGFIDMNNLIGYLPFLAANFLVGTGRYVFHQVCCWGYVVERRKQAWPREYDAKE